MLELLTFGGFIIAGLLGCILIERDKINSEKRAKAEKRKIIEAASPFQRIQLTHLIWLA